MTDTRKELALRLNSGQPIKEAAREIGISKRRAYELAQKLKLPYNPPIKPGAPKWRIIRSLVKDGYEMSEISQILKIAVPIIEEIVYTESLDQ
jgi:hypothetical protein